MEEYDSNTPCRAAESGRDGLAWLLGRAAHVARAGLDEVAKRAGLEGMRDYIVLADLARGPLRTQQAISRAMGLDKTTFTAVLDRLERAGLVVRRMDPTNRRARFPQITPSGRALHLSLTEALAAHEAKLAVALLPDELQALRTSLTKLVEAAEHEGVAPPGSCV